MPITVRCESCENAFRVPDAAQGKAVRCPKCKTKCRVPAGGAEPGAAKKVAKSEEDILADLDLDDLEDTSVRVCPKCGAEVDEDAKECPECNIDLATGSMSEATRRKLARKGPDPARYFKIVWKESWQFTKNNRKLAFRTTLYATVTSLLCFFCTFMVTWCVNTPPRVFWGGLALITFVVTPGWIWHLNSEVVKVTVTRQSKLPRIIFDFFGAVATGLTFLGWVAAFLIQMIVGGVGIALIVMGNTMVGAILIGVGVLLIVPITPVAMGHMAMPVTQPGWLAPKVLAGAFKSFGQCLYWTILLFVTCLPILATWGLVAATSGSGVARVAGTMIYNLSVVPTADPDAVALSPQAEEQPGSNSPTEKKPIEWKALIVPGIVWLVDLGLFGFIAIFNVQSSALLVYYCKRNLDLVATVKEKKYVSKAELQKQKEAKRLEKQQKKEEAKRQKELAKKEKGKKKRRQT